MSELQEFAIDNVASSEVFSGYAPDEQEEPDGDENPTQTPDGVDT